MLPYLELLDEPRFPLVVESHRAFSTATQLNEGAPAKSIKHQNGHIQGDHSRFIGMAIDSIAAQKERKASGANVYHCANRTSR